MRSYPQQEFSLAICTIKASSFGSIRGLPEYRRCLEPSNFWAMSFRYQARMVSGLATDATVLADAEKRVPDGLRLKCSDRPSCMRGNDHQQTNMYSYFSPEQRVRANHPLRAIRAMADEAL
jgi:hypothetical protein